MDYLKTDHGEMTGLTLRHAPSGDETYRAGTEVGAWETHRRGFGTEVDVFREPQESDVVRVRLVVQDNLTYGCVPCESEHAVFADVHHYVGQFEFRPATQKGISVSMTRRQRRGDCNLRRRSTGLVSRTA